MPVGPVRPGRSGVTNLRQAITRRVGELRDGVIGEAGELAVNRLDGGGCGGHGLLYFFRLRGLRPLGNCSGKYSASPKVSRE